MELTFQEQSIAFLYSIILGLVFGVIYGLFKIFRMTCLSGKVSVFLCDVVFMLLLFLVIFYFSLAYLYGYIRVYVIIGSFMGIVLYRVTLGALLSKIYTPLIFAVKKQSNKIKIKIKKIMKKLLNFPKKILYNVIIKKNSKWLVVIDKGYFKW